MGGSWSQDKGAGDPLVVVTLSVLILISGLGFPVMANLYRSMRRLTLHSKLVLVVTVVFHAAFPWSGAAGCNFAVDELSPRVRATALSQPSFGTAPSPPGAVVEVDHAAAETAFVDQFELQADVVGEGPFAASHHDRRDEQVALVHQPSLERLGGELGTADDHVPSCRGFHPQDRLGVEVPLDPRVGARCRLQRPGVHDLVGGLPYLPEFAHQRRPLAERGVGLPADHRLVHPAPVEVGAEGPVEVVDEGMHLIVWDGPVEVAVLVRYIAVERRDHRVDELS